jgi:hypothetical protein
MPKKSLARFKNSKTQGIRVLKLLECWACRSLLSDATGTVLWREVWVWVSVMLASLLEVGDLPVFTLGGSWHTAKTGD